MASNSIRATVTAGGVQLGAQLLPRPESNSTSVVFNNLPAGQVTLTSTAFPNADGTGVAQATGTAPTTITAGQTANVTVTMGSTIDHLDLAPANPSINVGANVQLTMTARNAANEVVLTSPSKVTWLSGTPGKATVDNAGKATGVAGGSSLITVTETESNKSASTTVTVTSGGGGGGGPLLNKIVFERLNPGGVSQNGGIFVMNPDGSNVIQIPNTTTTDYEPEISPDGTKILFVRGGVGVYTINPDGTNLTLISGDIHDQEPTWSPDGTKIAFLRLFNGNGDVMVMNANGTNIVNLTNTPNIADDEPSWSPDGTKIIFLNGSSNGIFVMNADGSNNHELPAAGDNPTFSPDGTKIAFNKLGGNRRIFVMNADGSNQVQISSSDDARADWSPDGTKLVFESTRDSGNGIDADLYVMNADGSNVVRLTSTAQFSEFGPKWR